MSSASSVRNLAAGRVAIGVSAWIAPRVAGRLMGLDPAGNPQSPYLARLFGVRDIALGVGALQSTGDAQRQWLTLGLACDVADAAAAALGGRDGSLPRVTAVVVGSIAVAAAAAGAQALQAPPAAA